MGDSESEDSDGEGGLGNVSRVIIRPPGQSGKAKRGHLCFDAAFETGNLGKADLVGDFEYDLYLRPDTCNPRYRFWFNFTVDNVKQDQRVMFHIVNISKPRNLFNSLLTPLVKSSSRPKWQRLPKKNVFYYRSLVHQNHYVLSFVFIFDKEDDVYQFAVAPPFSYSRLQAYLNVIESRQTEKRFERSILTKTLQNRNLDLITIDHVTNKTHATRLERNFIRIIVILCRSHSGAAPTSFLCQSFIDFLISNHTIAHTLRENFVFKIFPMVNPDGVFLGNNRCNLIGQDMNRSWNIATEFSHPTIYAIKNMLKEYDNSDSYQIDFVIDLHAHTSLHGCFIYGNTYEDVYRYERHLVFPRLFAANTQDYVAENTMFNADERKNGCARRYCCERLSDTVNAYTLEISMGGHYLKDGKTIALYTEDGYYRVGRNLARTFLHYYRFINVLPLALPTEIRKTKGSRARARREARRSRSRTRYEVKVRPRTQRDCAPIAYTNLEICYDSGGGGSSDEGAGFSPTRSIAPGGIHFSGYRNNYRRFTLGTGAAAGHTNEQLALLALKTGKFDNIYYTATESSPTRGSPKKSPTGKVGVTTTTTTATTNGNVTKSITNIEIPINVPPKPYLSIIDLNQLTRGSLMKTMNMKTRNNEE